MNLFIIAIFLIIILFFAIRYFLSLQKNPVPVRKKDVHETPYDEMKVSGNAYQCPICKGEYVFYHLYKSIENGDEIKEKLYKEYIAYNDLRVSASELDKAKLNAT